MKMTGIGDENGRGCITFGVTMQNRVRGSVTIRCSHVFGLCVTMLQSWFNEICYAMFGFHLSLGCVGIITRGSMKKVLDHVCGCINNG